MYDLGCRGHYGLGINYYSRVTSPLRRFSDVIASYCLDEFYFDEYDDKKIEKAKQKILKCSKKINNKRTSIEKFSLKYESK